MAELAAAIADLGNFGIVRVCRYKKFPIIPDISSPFGSRRYKERRTKPLPALLRGTSALRPRAYASLRAFPRRKKCSTSPSNALGNKNSLYCRRSITYFTRSGQTMVASA